MRHLQFICYESCPLDAWPETQLPCHDVPEAPHGDDAAGADAEMCRGYQLCQPGRIVDVLQQMPEEAQEDEFRDSVFTMFTQRSQPLAPSVDISNVFTLCTSKDEWNCSSAAVYTVQLFPSLPCSQRVEFRQPCLIHNARNVFPSSPPAVSHSGVFSQSSQPSLHAPGRRKKMQPSRVS